MHKNKSHNQAITNQRHKFPLFSMLTKHLPAFFCLRHTCHRFPYIRQPCPRSATAFSSITPPTLQFIRFFLCFHLFLNTRNHLLPAFFISETVYFHSLFLNAQNRLPIVLCLPFRKGPQFPGYVWCAATDGKDSQPEVPACWKLRFICLSCFHFSTLFPLQHPASFHYETFQHFLQKTPRPPVHRPEG